MEKGQYLEAIKAVMEAILDAPDDKTYGGTVMGTGGHARVFGENQCYKIVIPGDNRQVVLRQLAYLFGDLAVDLGLPIAITDVLYGRKGTE